MGADEGATDRLGDTPIDKVGNSACFVTSVYVANARLRIVSAFAYMYIYIYICMYEMCIYIHIYIHTDMHVPGHA
jgi:hypothetical protein